MVISTYQILEALLSLWSSIPYMYGQVHSYYPETKWDQHNCQPFLLPKNPSSPSPSQKELIDCAVNLLCAHDLCNGRGTFIHSLFLTP